MQERLGANVAAIHADPFCEGHFRAAMNLPDARQPGSYIQPAAMPGRAAVAFFHGQRARPHERHIAQQDVEELRQLIDARFPQEPADARNARVVLDLERRPILFALVAKLRLPGVGIGNHGAEFEDREWPAAHTSTALAEENRTAI